MSNPISGFIPTSWDLSSPIRDGACAPLHWKRRVFTPGTSPVLSFLNGVSLGFQGAPHCTLLQVWLETSASSSSSLSSLLLTSHHLPGLLILPRKFPHPCFSFPSLRVLFSLSSTQVDNLSIGPLLSGLSLFQVISHFQFFVLTLEALSAFLYGDSTKA